MKRVKKVLALILALAMVLSLLPSVALADPEIEVDDLIGGDQVSGNGESVNDGRLDELNLVFNLGETIDLTEIEEIKEILESPLYYGFGDICDEEDVSPYVEYSGGDTSFTTSSDDDTYDDLWIKAPMENTQYVFNVWFTAKDGADSNGMHYVKINASVVTPQANVTGPSDYHSVTVTSNFGLGNVEYGDVTPPVQYIFSIYEDEQKNQIATYGDWKCDYVVSITGGVDAYSFGLFGNYGSYGDVAFFAPENVGADDEIPLLTSVASIAWTYNDIYSLVQTFTCGAFNTYKGNLGKTFTVKLVIWDPEYSSYDAAKAANKVYVVDEIQYTIDTVSPLYINDIPYTYQPDGTHENGYTIDESGNPVLCSDLENFDGPHYAPITYVAQIGSAKYETLAEAFDAAQDGDTITMTANSVEQDPIVISGKSVTLDLNGKTVSFAPVGNNSYWGPTKTWFKVNSGAGLSVIDSATEKGQLIVDPEFTCTISFMNNSGTVNLGTNQSNGPVISMKVTTYKQAVDGTAYATTCATNRATVNGITNNGIINVKYAVMYLSASNLTGITTQKNATANIDHATFNITNGTTGLSSYNGSNSTIQNCSFVIHEQGTGIATNGAGASIADCTVTMSGTESMSASSAYGIRVNKSATASTEPDVEISNLTLTADYSSYGVTGIDVKAGHVVINSANVSIEQNNGDALVFGASALAGFENKAQLEVKGGFYSGDLSFWGKGTAVITGGMFNDDPSDYVAEGYVVIEDEGYYWVTLPLVATLSTTFYNEETEQNESLTISYTSLEEALTYVHSDGDVVTLLDNVTIDKRITIDNGKSFTLDLGGNELTCTDGHTFDLKNTFMTVQNGTLTGSQPFNVYASASSAYATGEYNTLTLKDSVTVNGSYAVILWYPKYGDPAYGTHIVIDGATLNGNVWVLGTIANGNSVIDIKSGTEITVVSADKDAVGVALQGYATVNIEAGVEISAPTGIEVAGGTLNLTGGTITGTAVPTSVEANNNGTTTEGAGIAVAPYGYSIPRLNISGGEINGYTALNIANPRTTDLLPVISVTGGKFTVTNEGTKAVNSAIQSVTGFISGGLYSTQPDAAYIATGYEAKAATSPVGYYEVVKSTGTAVDTTDGTSGTQYGSIPAAVEALVTDDAVAEITTGAAAVIGSVTIESGSTIEVAQEAVPATSGTVTVTEVTITKNEDSSTAYAVTTNAGSTLATTELGNGMDSDANPSDYVANVASMIANKVAASSATVNADLEVDLQLDVVADHKSESGNTVTYDVSLQGVFTVNGTASEAVKIANSALATDASFTFKVKAPEGAKLANVVHSWTNDPTYGTGSETFENLEVDEDGYVKITLTHFSKIDVTGLTKHEGDNKDVNSVYDVYMNLQEGLYLTYQVYVGDPSTDTAVLTNGSADPYEITLSSVAIYDESTYNAAMKQAVLTYGYYCVQYSANSPWYYFVVANYPNRMDNAVTLTLKNGSTKLDLYQNAGSTNSIDSAELYSVDNNVFSTSMVSFLNSLTGSSNSNTKAIAETLLDYYTIAYAIYH